MVAVLYDGGMGEENIRAYLSQERDDLEAAINLKVVLVSPDHTRKGLARSMIELFEQEATALGKRETLCTIHPRNTASRSPWRASS